MAGPSGQLREESYGIEIDELLLAGPSGQLRDGPKGDDIDGSRDNPREQFPRGFE